jgi:hypothetical protein
VDLKRIALRATKTAMGVAGTAKVAVTLHLAKGQTYNFDTDATAATGGSDLPVKVVKFKTREQQKADKTDRVSSFFIEGADIPAGVDPTKIQESDTLTEDATGRTWNIRAVDPVLEDVAYVVAADR